MSESAIHRFAERAFDRLPAVESIWHRQEADRVVDLRIQLIDDTWENREAVIDAMLDIQDEWVGELLVNFSFLLPDVAHDSSGVAAHSGERVHAFA